MLKGIFVYKNPFITTKWDPQAKWPDFKINHKNYCSIKTIKNNYIILKWRQFPDWFDISKMTVGIFCHFFRNYEYILLYYPNFRMYVSSGLYLIQIVFTLCLFNLVIKFFCQELYCSTMCPIVLDIPFILWVFCVCWERIWLWNDFIAGSY